MYKKCLLVLGVFQCFFASQAMGQLELDPANILLQQMPGQTVEIRLNLTNPASEAIRVFGLKLNYPAVLLDFMNCDPAETLTDGWTTLDCNENTDGQITISGSHTTPATESGVLIKVVFQTTETAGNGTLQLRDFVDNLTTAATSDGMVEIIDEFDLRPPYSVKWNGDDTLISIPLFLTNPDSQAIDAFGLTLNYPADLLDFMNCDAAETLSDGWTATGCNENTDGQIIIGGFDPIPATGSGILLKVVFQTSETSGNGTLQLTGFLNDLVGASTRDGLVTTVESTTLVVAAELPEAFSLEQNYPNPFNPMTTITYRLPQRSQVKLTIFNVIGRTVRTLVQKELAAGEYSAVWDGRNEAGRSVTGGLYFYRLEADSFQKVAKMLLVK